MRRVFFGLFAFWACGAASFCSAAPPAKALNNFVTELVRLEGVSSAERVAFTNPREGWIHIVARSRHAVTASFLEPEKMLRETIVFRRDEAGTAAEAMKHLPAGDYRLRLAVPAGETVETLLVRAIPAIFYNAYQRPSQLHECNDATRNWAFLEKSVNPHINTFVVHRAGRNDAGPRYGPSREVFDEWARRGKHWVDEVTLDFDAKSVEDAYQYYLSAFAVSQRGYDGYLVDEFCERPERREINRLNIEALARVAQRPDFAGKKIYPYVVTHSPKFSAYRDVWRFAVDNHFLLSQEWYVTSAPPKANMWDCFDPDWHANNLKRWNDLCPNVESSLMMTLAGWNLPDCSGDIDPQLDGKVLLDWQMNFLANHPAYRKLQGINVWTTSYMDEELIRWMCRLFRHYCIDGNKTRLSTDPYVLPHLVNPDFEDGTRGWDLQMAGPDSIRAGTLKDYGKIQGRYAYGTAKGDHFLVARRSEKRPNVIGQTVKRLTPGRLYSFRMYTADYGDLKTGRSKRQKHAVSIALSGAKPIAGRELHLPYRCGDSVEFRPFDAKHGPCWLNYHWLVFRAEGETAQLAISDWAGPQRPGGEVGQELVFNFFQVEPCF
jgi:hypothetical protein